MVIVSHDREFLDQLCTKVVETERGVSASYKGGWVGGCSCGQIDVAGKARLRHAASARRG